MIDFDSLQSVLVKLHYICSQEDKNELRVWLFNHGLFTPTPSFYRDRNSLLANVEGILTNIKATMNNLYPSDSKSDYMETIDDIQQKMRESIIRKEVEKALQAVESFQINGGQQKA